MYLLLKEVGKVVEQSHSFLTLSLPSHRQELKYIVPFHILWTSQVKTNKQTKNST